MLSNTMAGPPSRIAHLCYLETGQVRDILSNIELQGTRQELEQTSIHHNAPGPSITTMRT